MRMSYSTPVDHSGRISSHAECFVFRDDERMTHNLSKERLILGRTNFRNEYKLFGITN